MTARLRRWLVAIVACAAMVGLHAYSGEFPNEHVSRASLGTPAALYDATVTVNSYAIGQVLYNDTLFQGRSGVIYLAVNITIANPRGERSVNWQVGGEANGRTFAANDLLDMPQPGFRITQDVVFELDPADLAGFTVSFLHRATIYAYDPKIVVDLGITAERADKLLAADRYATVTTVKATPEVIR